MVQGSAGAGRVAGAPARVERAPRRTRPARAPRRSGRGTARRESACRRLITPSERSRGGRSMIPGSAGSRPSASAGSVSVPTSKASSCRTVSGSGIAPPPSAKTRNGRHLGGRVGEDVEDELADVVVDAAAGRDGGDDRGEVVVGEHHRRRLAGDVGPGAAHRDADVRAAQGGGVVDAVAGHRDHEALGAQRLGDPQLRLGRAAGEDQLAAARAAGASSSSSLIRSRSSPSIDDRARR